MKMKRLLAIFAIIAVLCTFCTVTAMADEASGEPAPGGIKVGDNYTIEGHEGIVTEVKAATCTADGFVTITADGRTYTEIKPATGHDFELIQTKAPTCQEEGAAEEVCSVCGAKGETVSSEKIDHSYTEVVVVKDDCTGYEYNMACEFCGALETTTVTDPVTGEEKEVAVLYQEGAHNDEEGNLKHSWSAWKTVADPTCSTSGLKVRTCSICGASEQQVIDATEEHNEKITAKVVNCETIVITTKCTNRGCAYEEIEVRTGNFHKLVKDEEASVPATCTTEGYDVYKCVNVWDDVDCGYEVTEEVEALGHDWGKWVAVDTYEDGAWYVHTCTREGCHETEKKWFAEDPNAAEPDVPEKPAEPDVPAEPVVKNVYALSTSGVDKGETTVSGTGTLLLVEGNQEVKSLLARIAVVYENEAGEQILVVNVAEIRDDMTFKIPSVKAPFGYTVKTVCVVGVNNDAAVDGAYGEYAICDNVVL